MPKKRSTHLVIEKLHKRRKEYLIFHEVYLMYYTQVSSSYVKGHRTEVVQRLEKDLHQLISSKPI